MDINFHDPLLVFLFWAAPLRVGLMDGSALAVVHVYNVYNPLSLREQLLWRRWKRKVIWMPPQMMWARFK